MADSKITALTALTAADPINDMLPIVDVSDTTMAASGTTKKISVNNILGASGTATLASATITGNLTVDTSTLKVDSTNNRVGVNTATPESDLDVRGLIAVRGTPTFPTTGVGPELFYSSGNSNSNLYSYNRATSAWVEMAYGALTHKFEISAGTAMTLNSTGLGIGVSPATSSKIHTLGNGTNVYAIFQNGDTLATNKTSQLWLSNGPTFLGANNREYRILNLGTSATAADLVFDYWTGTTIAERMRIDSSGNVGIGVTPSYRLTVQGADNSVIAQIGGTNRQLRLSTSAISSVDNASFNFIHTSGSGRFTFQNNSGTQTMLTIDDNGNNILRMPVTPPTLGVNLEGTFNLTSNTNLRISVRGSDGVTRVANITLA